MTKQTRQEKADAQLAELRRQHEECGGDYLTWAKKYNRHILKVCLINEQTGEESCVQVKQLLSSMKIMLFHI